MKFDDVVEILKEDILFDGTKFIIKGSQVGNTDHNKYIIYFKVPVKSNNDRKVEAVIMTDDGNRTISLICDGQYVEKIDSQHLATLKDEVLKKAILKTFNLIYV